MHKLVAGAYLILMIAVSSLLLLLPEAQEEVILTIAAMSMAHGAIGYALGEGR
jgi:hypothetical protein